MIKILCLFVTGVLTAYAQENAIRSLPASLYECYGNEYLVERDNRLPHTLNTFLAILRKIENTEGLNMDLRSLSVALLHRFRQDGIRKNPTVPSQTGVSPYAPIGPQFFRHAQTLRFIPGNAVLFPNNSISDLERCTLHFMLSSSVEIFERGDEGTVCRVTTTGALRNARSTNNSRSITDDVETLSPEQIEMIKSNKDTTEDTVDPSSLYPELPPNHPDRGRMILLPPLSKCPVENGVIKTAWGAVSIGPVLSGIAAAVQPQIIMLKDLLKDDTQDSMYISDKSVDNKWMATLGGDLAEVALIQGPEKRKEELQVGVNGDWNSTAMPRWYFLSSNENLEFTTAEIRGDLDGLILANEVQTWYSRIPNLRLSQIFDMYYSASGLFNSSIRACNRRLLFKTYSPNSTLCSQAFSCSLALRPYLARATIDLSVIEKFVVDAANKLSVYIPQSMNMDLTCKEMDQYNNFSRISVDLTIILDTNWPFTSIQPKLAYILENIEINQFHSNFTILNGFDGNPVINSSNNILDFYTFNSSNYQNLTSGLNLSKSFKALRELQYYKMNKERSNGIAGQSSDVVLIMPYNSRLLPSDKEYCSEQLRYMHEDTPDATVLILTYGSKDTWSDIVQDSASDLFSTGTTNTGESLAQIDKLISRIKQIPKRLINTQCGADYVTQGSSKSYVDYVEPFGTNFYKLHPNYFFSPDTKAIVKVQGSGVASLKVCSSRRLLHVNATEAKASASCEWITNNVHTISVSCGDANLIHECQALYLSVTANSSETYQCTEPQVCRFPNTIKYTISYENLVCTSNVNKLIFNPIFLIIAIICYLL